MTATTGISWVLGQAEPDRDAEGRVLGYIGTVTDITESKHHEDLLALQARRAEALLELPRIAESTDEAGLLQHGLALAETLTDSAISFVHFVNDDATIELVTWSKRTLAGYCELVSETHYPVHSAGLWADAVRKRRPIIVNDYNGYAHKQGLPEGHAALLRVASVPVIEHDRVVMIAGVGNKPADYSDGDVESRQLIANELWRLAQRVRAMEKLRLSERVTISAIRDSQQQVSHYVAVFSDISNVK